MCAFIQVKYVSARSNKERRKCGLWSLICKAEVTDSAVFKLKKEENYTT